VQVRDQWRGGKVVVALEAWVAVFPQMVNPSPIAIGNAAFRRALLHAIDRQEMVDTIQYGLVPVAHSPINPTEPAYADVEPLVAHYDYDPRRAAELIEGLGYTRGLDGSFRDGSGQPLVIEVRTTGDDVQAKSMASIADFWQRSGVRVEQLLIPQARANDREYRSVRSGFELSRYPANPNIDGMQRYHSAQTPLPENNYTGTNKARYVSSELRPSPGATSDTRISCVRSMIRRQSSTCWGLWTHPKRSPLRLSGPVAPRATARWQRSRLQQAWPGPESPW